MTTQASQVFNIDIIIHLINNACAIRKVNMRFTCGFLLLKINKNIIK
jgi:hypothetical protein